MDSQSLQTIVDNFNLHTEKPEKFLRYRVIPQSNYVLRIREKKCSFAQPKYRSLH